MLCECAKSPYFSSSYNVQIVSNYIMSKNVHLNVQILEVVLFGKESAAEDLTNQMAELFYSEIFKIFNLKNSINLFRFGYY